MEISLSCSSLIGTKLVLPRPLSCDVRQPRKFNIISCRATKLCEEKGRTNFFKVLSLDPDHVVGVDEIKRAYRTMALQYHPDVCHPSRKEESTRMFVELNKAYKTLLDQTLAEDYDYEFHLREKEVRDGFERERWEEQLRELRKKSDCRMARKEGSWGSRLRAQHQ